MLSACYGCRDRARLSGVRLWDVVCPLQETGPAGWPRPVQQHRGGLGHGAWRGRDVAAWKIQQPHPLQRHRHRQTQLQSQLHRCEKLWIHYHLGISPGALLKLIFRCAVLVFVSLDFTECLLHSIQPFHLLQVHVWSRHKSCKQNFKYRYTLFSMCYANIISAYSMFLAKQYQSWNQQYADK